MFGDFLASWEVHPIWSQTGNATFGATFFKIGLLFILASGHTACIL